MRRSRWNPAFAGSRGDVEFRAPRRGFSFPGGGQMKRIRFAALLLVASCNSHNSTSFKSADAAALTDAGSISDPSIADVAAARARILDRFPNPQVWFGPVAAPRNCADGNMSGEPVRACEVCALVLRAAPSTHWMDEFDLSVEKLTLFIPFKRAISYDQPDVTPVGNASGCGFRYFHSNSLWESRRA